MTRALSDFAALRVCPALGDVAAFLQKELKKDPFHRESDTIMAASLLCALVWAYDNGLKTPSKYLPGTMVWPVTDKGYWAIPLTSAGIQELAGITLSQQRRATGTLRRAKIILRYTAFWNNLRSLHYVIRPDVLDVMLGNK